MSEPRHDRTDSRESLELRYPAIRGATRRLSDHLSPEDCQIQTAPDVSPIKWHLAHTTWFFETFVLARELKSYKPFNPQFVYLYNSYYNTVGAQFPRSRRGLLSRPSLEEVIGYREHVDEMMAELIETRRDRLGEIAAVIELGLNHEQQHQELVLSDIKHILGANPLHPVYADSPDIDASTGLPVPAMGWVGFDEGLRWIGHEGDGFAFDNEGPRHRVFVERFEFASRLVTIGEYLEFVEDGGYRRPELWLADGWAELEAGGWDVPLYWQRDKQGISDWTLRGRRPLRLDEPVCHVSFYEADAYARWRGVRLPWGAEWEVAAQGRPIAGNMMHESRLHPQPATSEEGIQQLYGDVWEWSATPYGPYPGYRPATGALGEYNGKFMCNQIVLRGGSCVTPRSHLRVTYRNFLPPSTRWQFAGIRLARDPVD